MATGTTIANAPTITNPSGSVKMPASDGSGLPRSITLEQVKDFISANIGAHGLLPPMTESQYNSIPVKDTTFYFIITPSGNLAEIYWGSTLIARRRQDGEDVNLAFPLVLPFVFG